MSAAIEVRNLRKTFGKNVAVDGVGFTIPAGKVFGFVGPNGAGKTTTLRVMATLDEPDAGDVLVNGCSAIQHPEDARRLIGFMPDALPEFSDITAHEHIDFFARAYGLRGATLDRRVREVEEFTGLLPFRGKVLSALSKGMKQRVCLARALAHDPAVLLLDEPAAGLDPRARIELRDMVRALAGRGKTLLISSHILGELSEMCSGLLIIERGKLLQNGTLEDLAQHAAPACLCVALRVLEDDGRVEKILRETARVKTFQRAVAGWRVEVEGGEDAAAELLASLLRGGARVVSFHAQGATLEDIFMNLTKGDLA